VSVQVAEQFVDAVLADSWLRRPEDLLAAMRSPAGRNPAQSSRDIAQTLSALDDAQVLPVVAAALDAAYFSIFNSLDADMKNSGVRVEISTEKGRWNSAEFSVPLHEIYRGRVELNGCLRKLS
jgi:hypothetical protein